MTYDWKYPKIVNYKLGMSKELYLVQEKIDGCNIQLEFTPNGKMVVYSRSTILNTSDKLNKLFGLGQFLEENEEVKQLTEMFKVKSFNDKKYYRLAGEYFGNSIQKRINYNENMSGDKCFRIFDIFIEGCKLPPVAYLKAVEGWNIKELCAPQQLYEASSVDDLVNQWKLNYDLEKVNSFYSSEHGWEGVVIKNSKEMVKMKRESFGELTIKTTKEKKELDISENSDILDLVNENRVLSAQSKLGEFSPKDFNKWLLQITSDVFDDYDKDVVNCTHVIKAVKAEISKLLKKMYM